MADEWGASVLEVLSLFVTKQFSFEVECDTTLLSLLFFDVFQCVTLSALFHLFALIKYSTKSLQEHFFSRESEGFWGDVRWAKVEMVSMTAMALKQFTRCNLCSNF